MKRILLLILLNLSFQSNAQLPTPTLVGYWHNWSDVNAPYIPLDLVDNRYNVIEVSFAVPTSPSDMTMLFTPDGISSSQFITKVQYLQSQGKKVLISIGGANTSIDLTTMVNKNAFISSMTGIINTYRFDGIDIDIENGNSILAGGGTITNPSSIAQINLIDAIKQIMANYRTNHSAKLILTMAPETAYVQGGQSAYGGIWGGYLPIIHGLRDSLDLLQVQLYNSGSMYGIDGAIYTQGTADFIVAMTEAVIHGFNTGGGFFIGLPADKIAVGLPACTNAAGGGFTDTASVRSAIMYLRGYGPPAGNYLLTNVNGYPTLRAMMTWSVNWDAVSTCGSSWEYANNFQTIFGISTAISEYSSKQNLLVYPNASNGNFKISNYPINAKLEISNLKGEIIFKSEGKDLDKGISLQNKGVFILRIIASSEVIIKKLIIE
ncbi:MAG TPA: glycosyl hydrolase family 18 protein [Bacteroidia bacterium]|nr:glycosyl hydrolase family 18 protein [Bacteroidia bacterium]